MKTAKTILLLGLTLLSVPSAMADLIGNNTRLTTVSSITSRDPAGFFVRNEKSDVTYGGKIEVNYSANNPVVTVTVGSEQRKIVVPTNGNAQALVNALSTGQSSVNLIFHAQDCKGESCSSVKGNVYDLNHLEITVGAVTQPLETYLASVSPTNDQLVASQLGQLGGLTGLSGSLPSNSQVHGHSFMKDGLVESAQASDQVAPVQGNAGNTLK